MVYEDRIVAFIDVLGFSELVNASESDPDAGSKIETFVALSLFFKQFVRIFLTGTIDQGTFFSDSFVISMPTDRVIYLVREIGIFTRFLMRRGFSCRGAIVAGPLYHRESIIVGPALIKAYQTENSIAIYPRIVLDDIMMKHWEIEFRKDESGSGPAYPDLERLVKRDRDGQYFLDIFTPLWDEFFHWPDHMPDNPLPVDPTPFLEAANLTISKGLELHRGNNKILAKYEWLASQLNDQVLSPG